MSTAHKSREYNFAARLVDRLTAHSGLIDAATGDVFGGGEIAARIADFAGHLLSAGLQPGDRLVIGCSLTPDAALAYLGAIYAGVVPVTVDERTLFGSGLAVCTQAAAKAVWTRSDVQVDWAARNAIPVFRGFGDSAARSSVQPSAVSDDDLAVLVPTSGSTGVPRLVMVTHGNLIANTEAIIRSQGLGEDERAMLVLPFSYCFGASVLHTHLYEGGSVVFDSRFMFPDKVLRAIDMHHCTTFAGVPSVYNILLRRSNLASIPLPTLRRFLQAGGALSSEDVRRMREAVRAADFFVMYGQTEATARISCFSARDEDQHLGGVGRPLENLEVRVVDEQDRLLPSGDSGEIQVRGPSVCAGYFNDPDATAERFSGEWLRTNDLGSFDDQGYLTINGRTSDFLKIRGVRVSVGEVESTVSAIDGVYECAATSAQHPEAGEALALFIVAEKDSDGLAQRVRRALPPLWTCASVSVVPALPRTANGKVARTQLRSMV